MDIQIMIGSIPSCEPERRAHKVAIGDKNIEAVPVDLRKKLCFSGMTTVIFAAHSHVVYGVVTVPNYSISPFQRA